MTTDGKALYVWACRVCRDPDYVREGQGTFYMDERYCPTCEKRQPIVPFPADDVPRAATR